MYVCHRYIIIIIGIIISAKMLIYSVLEIQFEGFMIKLYYIVN